MTGFREIVMRHIKAVSLFTLVLQTTTLVLSMRYSRTVEGPLYFSSTAVLLAEIVKLITCIILVALESGRTTWSGYASAIYDEVFSKPIELAKVAVPAGLYAVQNNLLFVALSNLDAATYQVVYQLKILTTALFSVVMLGKPLSLKQWGTLFVLTLGVTLVQWQSSDKPAKGGNALLGLMAILTACFSSGFAGVYFEKILKNTSASVWVRNIQLALSGSLFSLVVMWVNDGSELARRGFWHGYTPLTWAIVVNQALGGLIVAVVVKYADNIVKGFGAAVSIVLSSLLSWWLFEFRLTGQFAVGAALVVGSVFIYNNLPAPSPVNASSISSSSSSHPVPSPRLEMERLMKEPLPIVRELSGEMRSEEP